LGPRPRRLSPRLFQRPLIAHQLTQLGQPGTRAAWRGAAELAAGAGVSAPIAIALAEAIFVYGDELATDVVEGYLRMQSDEAGERERRRRRLAQLLLDPAAHDPEAVARAAELARWPVPRALAVLALAAEHPMAVARRLDFDALAGADAVAPGMASSTSVLILPDPDGPGRRAALDTALADEPVALGPSVASTHAHRSLQWARLTLQLARQGALPSRPRAWGADATPPAGGLVRTSDHLATVILLQDPELARNLASERLRALDQLAGAERERLLSTLAAWLAHQRHTPRIASELHVHPQTVRYRIAKLRERLGDAMETPQGRFELDLALRIEAGGVHAGQTA